MSRTFSISAAYRHARRRQREGDGALAPARGATTWHPTYADFTGYYGVRPWACAPYRPQTKGKVESGVKYVARNALAGKRFHSWAHLNA